MKSSNLLMCGILAAGLLASSAASAFVVEASDDIFLAGQSSVPSGFPASIGGVGAGTLPYALTVTPGETLTLTATGSVSCCSGADANGPDGGGFGGPTNIPGYGNVAGVPSSANIPDLALLGVFNAGSTPWTPFLIGSSDTFVVPAGATTLYLGFADAFGFDSAPGTYDDNTGSLSVSAGVPEPSTWATMLIGFVSLGFAGYLRIKRTRPAAKAA